jgi:hypothetical protein
VVAGPLVLGRLAVHLDLEDLHPRQVEVERVQRLGGRRDDERAALQLLRFGVIAEGHVVGRDVVAAVAVLRVVRIAGAVLFRNGRALRPRVLWRRVTGARDRAGGEAGGGQRQAGDPQGRPIHVKQLLSSTADVIMAGAA